VYYSILLTTVLRPFCDSHCMICIQQHIYRKSKTQHGNVVRTTTSTCRYSSSFARRSSTTVPSPTKALPHVLYQCNTFLANIQDSLKDRFSGKQPKYNRFSPNYATFIKFVEGDAEHLKLKLRFIADCTVNPVVHAMYYLSFCRSITSQQSRKNRVGAP
jgi:hypothetical protein